MANCMVDDDKVFSRKIVWLSFFLAVGIVFRHANNIDVYGLDQGFYFWFIKYVEGFTDLIVPTFFVLSGYLFFQNFSYKKLLTKWKARFWSLVVPYLIWNLLAYLYYEFISLIPMVANSMNGIVEPLSLKCLLQTMLWGDHNILWFIRYLIAYVYVMPIFFVVLKRKGWAGLSLPLILCFVWWSESRCVMYSAFFWLGGFVGVHYKSLARRRYSAVFLCASAVVLVVTVALHVVGYAPKAIGNHNELYCIVRMFQAMAIWVVADIVLVFASIPWWAHLSFAIYVMHSMILESIEKFFLVLIGRTLIGAIVDFIFAPILTVIIIIVVAWISQRIVPRAWGISMGGRGVRKNTVR